METYQFVKNQINNGRIFFAVFMKKDGTERRMLARLGVKKYLHGGQLPWVPKDHDMITVFDMIKKEYRHINVSTMKLLKANKQTFNFNENE
jgi:hypothetical protein